MTKLLLVTAAVASLLLFGERSLAADKADAKTELKALVDKINGKLQEGKKTEKELAEDIKTFDALLERHKGEKTDDVAQILLMKARLYLEVFDDTDKGMQMMKQLKADFPDTEQGKMADKVIASIQKQEESKKVQRGLVVGAKFPDFAEKDTAGKPLSVANYKGKVVLVDFWASWCGPCVAELPNVLKTYEKYHAKGFEIIGISLDRDEDAFKSFIKRKNMTWAQYFDGKGWENKLAGKYGVTSIPATYLLDAEGKIAGKNLRGEELEAAVAKILAKP